MYKIMMADDEGIVLDALTYIVQKNFGDQCQVRTAKSGRAAIELAEEFQPDIVLMDIRMPGINGIDAIRELRQTHRSTIFIVVSAYDDFDYAKESIDLGVMAFITKPVRKAVAVEAIQKAMNQVDAARKKRTSNLMIREKLETALPMLESGFIYSVLLQNVSGSYENYCSLLGIEQDCGYLMVLETRSAASDEDDLVEQDTQAFSAYGICRNQIKAAFQAVVGPLMANRIIAVVPCAAPGDEYTARLAIVEQAQALVQRLERRTGLSFRMGIGSIQPMSQLYDSYRQAVEALEQNGADIAHFNDLPLEREWEEGYPSEQEYRMYDYVEEGNLPNARLLACQFFDCMTENYGAYPMDIKLKALELVMRAEYIAFHTGGQTYHFLQRRGYLETVLAFDNYADLRGWYLDKITAACRSVSQSKADRSVGTVALAQEYIRKNYRRDLTLDEVSREVHVSPYYFSKLFKDEVGENFVEYLTKLRITQAKRMLLDPSNSIKQVCLSVGYGDPSYFSRIFKKYEGVTPTEFRDAHL